LTFSYAEQPKPEGLAQAFIIGEQFIGNDNVCLILGDNIFYGASLIQLLNNAISAVENENKAVVFGYYVNDPERYGVVEFDKKGNVLSIEEKPKTPKSNYAVVGIYFYTNDVINIAKKVKPSWRNELEITSVNQAYLKQNRLKFEVMGRGYAWLDTGTHEALAEATAFVETIEKRQGLKVACIEEIAWRKKYISKKKLKYLSELKNNKYSEYLYKISENYRL